MVRIRAGERLDVFLFDSEVKKEVIDDDWNKSG
jgi:hypothetical protein